MWERREQSSEHRSQVGSPVSAGCGCGGGSWPRKHRAGQNKDLSNVNILRGGHEQEYEQDIQG